MVNISQESSAFFQTDAEIAKLKEKEAKYNYTKGDAIKLSSKALEIQLDKNKKYMYVAESGFLVRKISLTTSKTVKLFKGHQGPVTSIALSDDRLWTGSWDKTIKQWDLMTGECLATLEGHTDFVKSLVIVGDFLYSGSSDGFLRKWNRNTLDCVTAEKKHKRAIESLAASESGQWIYSASSDGHVLKWDADTMQVLQTYQGHDTSVYCVRVWEEDLWTASADKTVRRWHTETGQQDMVLTHPDRVKSIVLAGPYIVTGSSDDMIRVWDIGSGQLLCTIEGHFDEVSSLDILGSTLYSGSLDCSVRKWSLTVDSMKHYNESRLRLEKKEEKQISLTENEERELEELLMSDDDE
ncbi:WD40-repeat-containing domain protein [Cokeromyces recurvatus]|uniref:WD40-repeat-containing domain protein n=1 Tax=Cokeromyces recurvatus TaxID=90255 RepID=UPI00221E973E|nr:WD40-repeat-containing domain protein [Cokeromyces recurvatus]KAI7906881.1 WD40-repeat-containing domain protein [Cokeromyces recurvatus]